MGEIADDMINGRCCALCGCYFEHRTFKDVLYEHGYPAVCEECWEGLTEHERTFHQKCEDGVKTF